METAQVAAVTILPGAVTPAEQAQCATREVASPALLLFEERIESNLRLMIKIAGGPERLRPHVKTHKLGPLVKRQIELGIKKFKCATIAEAELAASAGAADVLLAYQATGPRLKRFLKLVELFPRTRFAVMGWTSLPLL